MTKQTTALTKLWRTTTIDAVTGCWICINAPDKDGYSRVYFMGRSIISSRVSAHLFLGLNIHDKKEQANHKPGCLNRNCWNPDHLYVGNQYQNIRDSVNAGTHVVQPFCRRTNDSNTGDD